MFHPSVGLVAMAAAYPTESETSSEITEPVDAREIKTTRAELDAKMPTSVKSFTAAYEGGHGRVTECQNCGAVNGGVCGECGYKHPELRAAPER